MNAVAIFFSLLPFYFLGAFPTGLLLSKLHGVDISTQGSGNTGATNVARVLGKRAGILTLVIDVFKGALGVGLAKLLVGEGWFEASAGFAVVAGHCFSIPRYLKGGKGVATALGVISVLYPSSSIVALLSFAGIFAAWRIVSLASIGATLLVPCWALVTNAPDATILGFMAIAGLIVYRHEQNLKRLIEGNEPKFVLRKAEVE